MHGNVLEPVVRVRPPVFLLVEDPIAPGETELLPTDSSHWTLVFGAQSPEAASSRPAQ